MFIPIVFNVMQMNLLLLKRRVFQLILIPAILACALPSEAQFNYTTFGNRATITQYTGTNSNVIIPDAINGWPVTDIGFTAFSQNESVTNVVIPDSVFSIDSGAFVSCTNLVSVSMGTNVATIGDASFAL